MSCHVGVLLDLHVRGEDDLHDAMLRNAQVPCCIIGPAEVGEIW